VTWASFQQDGSESGIYQQRYDATGNPVGGETRVNTTTFSYQAQAAVAGLADIDYVVTWMSYQQDGSGRGIYQQRYDADANAIGSETRVNTITNNEQSDAAVAGLADGRCTGRAAPIRS
jgi:hypothetical protein